jgi:hypothetical protein
MTEQKSKDIWNVWRIKTLHDAKEAINLLAYANIILGILFFVSAMTAPDRGILYMASLITVMFIGGGFVIKYRLSKAVAYILTLLLAAFNGVGVLMIFKADVPSENIHWPWFGIWAFMLYCQVVGIVALHKRTRFLRDGMTE